MVLINPFENNFLTVQEYADEYKICLATAYRHVNNGAVPAFKVGNNWRIRRDWSDKKLKESTL